MQQNTLSLLHTPLLKQDISNKPTLDNVLLLHPNTTIIRNFPHSDNKKEPLRFMEKPFLHNFYLLFLSCINGFLSYNEFRFFFGLTYTFNEEGKQ